MRTTTAAALVAALLTVTGCGRLERLRDPAPADGTAAAADPAVAAAFAKVQARAARFERECRASGAGAGGTDDTAACELRDEYAELLEQWRAGQALCDAGDGVACNTLVEAASRVPAMDP